MEGSGMMGLMVLGALAVYLLVSIWVTKTAVSWAKANNKKSWLWGGLAAFMMYNLVFWDLIPTLVMHKYYCATQAGFWVYKTPEQWVKENPELTAEDLKLLGKDMNELSSTVRNAGTSSVFISYDINRRLYAGVMPPNKFNSIFPVNKKTLLFFADKSNGTVLAEEITFGSGYGSPMTTGGIMGLKGWLENSTCSNSDYAPPLGKIDFTNKIFALRK